MAFPLRLSPFEEYLLLENRPSFPMNFFLRLRFQGTLRYDVWNSAIRQALVLHPLLHANVERVGKKRLQWTGSPESPPQIERTSSASFSGRHSNLEQQTGLRIGAAQSGNSEFSVLFQFHHSCCDGFGASQFIDDLLLAYSQHGRAAAEAMTTSKKPDLRELRHRARFGLTPLKLARVAPRQTVGLLGARQFIMRKPQPLIDGSSKLSRMKNTLPVDYPSTITYRFDKDQTQQILGHTKRLSVTLNDLVVRDLLMSIDEFKDNTANSDNEWLRLTVPVSLRQHVSAQMPAANVLSFVFLERRRRDMKHPERMLASLSREMRQIKRNKLGLTFVLSLAAARGITGSLARLMPKDEQCLATAVLTNPGILFCNSSLADKTGYLVASDIRLADIEFIAPFRPNTWAAFSVYTYAKQLRITTHFDTRALSEVDAQRIHSTLVRRVSQSAIRS